jgi:ACR3 family arsenite efflux pump ArsB
MSIFEHYLILWMALCAVGIALGHVTPSAIQAIGPTEIGRNLTKLD